MSSVSAKSLEAILFALGEPIEKKRLATLLDVSGDELVEAIQDLRVSLKDHGITIVQTEQDIELRTAPEVAHTVQKLREHELTRDLGKASLETLAVIAYRAGATRSDIDWVRGVNSSASVRTLLMRGLIEGREDEKDKRRIHYSVTIDALAHLGVSCVEDLPRFAELSHGATTVLTEETRDVAVADETRE